MEGEKIGPAVNFTFVEYCFVCNERTDCEREEIGDGVVFRCQACRSIVDYELDDDYGDC